jgi:3-methyladenine DNA glycosylase AlkD
LRPDELANSVNRSMIHDIRAELHRRADAEKAKILLRFFKTGPGDYGEGDRFIGVVVPDIRRIAQTYRETDFATLSMLLRSPIHEERFLALVILTLQAKKADPRKLERLARFYLKHLKGVNNWDLVDVSARDILGPYFLDRDKKPLYGLLASRRFWDRRVAILTTYHFIQKSRTRDTFEMARRLLGDQEDLMHKASGWMLREAGKKDPDALHAFLEKHRRKMPRTMLRYAIERFSPAQRRAYLRS